MPEKIVDACCLINLYAAGNTLSILGVFGGSLHVTDLVQGEAMEIRRPDDEDTEKLVPSRIDLSEAIEAGLIGKCHLEGSNELEAFVRFAVDLDDGEAACLAIAASRGWTVATDDRKAIRLASEAGIPTLTTPQLIDSWVTATMPSEAEVAAALCRIERFARFRPRRTDPLYGWWTGMTAEGRTD